MLSQKVLEALFGDQAVRRLADEARADLRDRVGALLAGEEGRFTDLLAAHATDLPRRRGAGARGDRGRGGPVTLLPGRRAERTGRAPPRPSPRGCARWTGSSSSARAASTRRC